MSYQATSSQHRELHDVGGFRSHYKKDHDARYILPTIVTALMIASYLVAMEPAKAASEAEINAIIRSLAPIAGQTISSGYGRPDGKTATTVIMQERSITIDHRYAVDVEVYFPFGSARLTKRARKQLNVLGQALASKKLRQYTYVIGGHTDAKGSEAYNRDLSLRRAMAVRDFLIVTFPIDPSRLIVVGWGESAPKDQNHPYAAINRRVETVLVVPVPIVTKRSRRSKAVKKADVKHKYSGSNANCIIRTLRDPRNPHADLDDFTLRRKAVCSFPGTDQ